MIEISLSTIIFFVIMAGFLIVWIRCVKTFIRDDQKKSYFTFGAVSIGVAVLLFLGMVMVRVLH